MYGNSDTKVTMNSRWGAKHTALTCCAIGMLLATGCANRILNADFDKYAGTPTAGDALDRPIPGLPEGDTIENTENVEVVVDEVIRGKTARIRGQMDLLPAAHTTPDMYVIKWTGMRSFIANEGVSTVSFLDEDGDAALVLEFEGATGRLHWRTGDDPAPSTMLGGLVHDIEITIDMRGVGNIDVMINEMDGSPNRHENLDFLEAGFDELARIRFEGAANATYYLAELDAVTKSSRMR